MDKTRIAHGKGFNAALFECIDESLCSRLGKLTVSTLYYAIQERQGVPEDQISRRPLDVLKYLKEILGENGFRAIENSIIISVKMTFEVREDASDVFEMIELARRNYLLAS
jgi:hypothetical protein